jgi:hypothetical protein
VDEVIPGDGEVIVIVNPTPDTEPAPGTVPVDPAPGNQAPGNQAPVDQAPVDQTPVNPAPVDPADVPVSAPVTGGFFVRTVDSTGAQVGDILTAETGATRMVVRGLENGAAYRFQVAPAEGGSEPRFSELSGPVVPGATQDERRAFNQDAALRSEAAPVGDQPLAQVPGVAPFGGALGTATAVSLAALAQYLVTEPGTAVLAITTGGLLAACGLLVLKLYRSRANARKVLADEARTSTKA